MIFRLTFIFLLACCIPQLSYAARVDTIGVFSTVMNKKIPAAVVLPAGYNGNQPLPVLYLLHGYTDRFNGWLTKTPEADFVNKMADKYNILIVCPDGGYSWYMDSPLDKNNQYETHLTKELIPFIDNTYKTKATREGRVISGLSMGGHGALYLAIRNPNLFIAAGSIAGALDFSSLERADINKNFVKLLGDKTTHMDRYTSNSILHMTGKLKSANLKLIVDCGTNDFLYETNKAFHKKLLEEKIEHDYTERPGAHNWAYFSNSLEYHLVFFQKIFTQP